MLKRKIDNHLRAWKEKSEKLPLVVLGARQVGKTTSIRELGKLYEAFYEINFIRQPAAMDAFSSDLSAEAILSRLSLIIPDFHIVDGDTLILLDEIQECPEARTALKFLAECKRVDVISSGSLLGVKYKDVSSYPVGYVEYLTMYPLDFEEFMWASGLSESIIKSIADSFDNRTPVDSFIHTKLLELFRTYIVVGGMPNVVEHYIVTKNFQEVINMQRAILKDYELDIVRYAEGSEKQKIRACFLSIPNQLAKANHKFQYSAVEKGSTRRKYGTSILWLSDANVALFCYNISRLEFPLSAYKEDDDFKLYLCDTGLLVSMYEEGTAKDLICGEFGLHKGAIYENAIAQQLAANGFPLYFYKPSQTLEIDFVIRFDNKVTPIEVKAGYDVRSKSLSSILAKGNGVKKAIRISARNVGEENGIISIPLYMAYLVKPDSKDSLTLVSNYQ